MTLHVREVALYLSQEKPLPNLRFGGGGSLATK